MKFYETIKKYENENITIYCDMDGVLAEYDIGNFDYKTIRPLMSNITKIENLMKQDNISVKILSICKTNDIINDKKVWFKKYMPFLKEEDMILISKELTKYSDYSSKEIKSNYLKENIKDKEINILIDDDNSIIKYIIKNNKDIIVFQVSSLID
ncbi:MAG: hypothetical protein J6J17_04955 [Bacilli bacterium]|nr:hypothetical protein [Bacilli bacterium]